MAGKPGHWSLSGKITATMTQNGEQAARRQESNRRGFLYMVTRFKIILHDSKFMALERMHLKAQQGDWVGVCVGERGSREHRTGGGYIEEGVYRRGESPEVEGSVGEGGRERGESTGVKVDKGIWERAGEEIQTKGE